MCDPTQFTINAISQNSLSSEYDKARFEWNLNDYKNEASEGFSNICQLCGNPHLKHNFIIHNPNTDRYLSVGSTCIIRFGVVKGNIDVESGTQIVENFMNEREYYFHVRSLVKGMMVLSPDAKEFKMFFENLKKILELRNINNPTIDQLGDICYADRWEKLKNDKMICARLHMLWYKPMQINTIKTKAKKVPVYKEGTTFGHKSRTTVYIPAAGRSTSYKTDNISD
ncbi:hypothetical protein [Paenibacillus sp. FSL H3-0286]|uniref:hypothetical protein n=1 Tax=Paenibacillus sp. FSL H3-0286 TaxID=2921427 RepID=UPI00324E3A4C